RVLAFDGPEVADAAADVGAYALRLLLAEAIREFLPALYQLAVVDGLVGGGDGVVDEGTHLARLLLLDELQGVEALDLGGDLHGELRGVELLYVADAATARHQRGPSVRARVAAG